MKNVTARDMRRHYYAAVSFMDDRVVSRGMRDDKLFQSRATISTANVSTVADCLRTRRCELIKAGCWIGQGELIGALEQSGKVDSTIVLFHAE